jgi:hypothetical protein
MKINNMVLHLTRNELIEIIENNLDKNDVFKDKILNIINNFPIFSVKQGQWILSKVTYITNHNPKYKNINKRFINFELEI